jgi:hypothetical protein
MRFALASLVLVLMAGCAEGSSSQRDLRQGAERACTTFNRAFEKLGQPTTVVRSIVFFEGDIADRDRLIASLDELNSPKSDVPDLRRMVASFERISSAELGVIAYLKALNPLRRAGMTALGKVVISRRVGEPLRRASIRARSAAHALSLPTCVTASR